MVVEKVPLKQRVRETISPPPKAYFYKPAAVWMVWEFLGGIAMVILGVWQPIHLGLNYGVDVGVSSLLPWNLVQLFLAVFMLAHGTIMFLVATGYFVVLGDAGIFHVENLDAVKFGPITTAIEMHHKKLKVRGKDVKIWVWGRLGGIRGVVSGGGKDGYTAICVAHWFESLTEQDPIVVGPGQMGVPRMKVLDGYRPTEDEQEKLQPGDTLSNVVVARYHAWKTSSKRLPLALRLKVENDWKWKEWSPVWVLYDPIPSKTFRKSEMTPGAMTELWGYIENFNDLVLEHQALGKNYSKLSSTYTGGAGLGQQ